MICINSYFTAGAEQMTAGAEQMTAGAGLTL